MKITKIIFRILFGLVLLIPILGALGVFPAPTADLYTPQAWAFMQPLMATGYMLQLIGVTCLIGLILVIMNKMALAAVIVAPLTVNVILFHAFLEHTPITAMIPAAILVVCNAFFLWTERKKYKALW